MIKKENYIYSIYNGLKYENKSYAEKGELL